jgi:type VI secretion system protein ImpL
MKKILTLLLKEKYLLMTLFPVFLLLWFLTPKLGITNIWGRIGLLLLIPFMLASLILWYKWLVHYRGTSLANEIQTQQGQTAGKQLEIALFKEKMNEAVNALKTSRLGIQHRGKAALYALPWFVIIGPSAAGKSTLIRNSGLNFPFNINEDPTIKGLGGTRNCDWWFSDQAILLDTAGRYTTEENDHDEWFTFLSLLKKYRRRQPINGIIVAMSFTELLTADTTKQKQHVSIIRDRIEELTDQLGFIFPVFLVFTKCDLLKGFEAFFNNINTPEREQVWGISTSNHFIAEDFNTLFLNQCEELSIRLSSQRLRKLTIEQDITKKQEIYDFPDQFDVALSKIKTFIQDLCNDNPYQKAPKLFGVYFTSGEQNTNSSLSLSFDETNTLTHTTVSKKLTSSKNYFIKTLFNDIIFPKQLLPVNNHKRSRFQKRLKILSIMLAILFITSSAFLFQVALTNNTKILQKGVYAAHTLTKHIQKTDCMTVVLSDFQPFYQALKNKALLPWYQRLGLYRGKKLSAALENMFSSVMQTSFLEPTGTLLKKHLTDYSAQWEKADHIQKEQLRGPYYAALKAYLTLCYPSKINPETSSLLLAQYWFSSESKPSYLLSNKTQEIHQIQQLAKLTQIYLSQLSLYPDSPTGLKPLRIDAHLVELARSQLYLPLNAKNLFFELQMRYQTKLSFLPVHDLVHTHHAELLQSSTLLPAMYTKSAWNKIIKPEIKRMIKQTKHGDWVIDGALDSLDTKTKFIRQNNPQQSKQLLHQIYQEYDASYQKAWSEFLGSVSVKPFTSLEDADKKLAILGSAQSPILKLLSIAHTNMQSHYETLLPEHRLKDYSDEIAAVRSDIQHLATSPNRNADIQNYASKILSKQGSNLALYRSVIATKTLLENTDNLALNHLLLSPIQESFQVIVHQAISNIQTQWKNQVFPDYLQNIHNKFPFADSKQNAEMIDTSDFFKPDDGILWQFVMHQLSAFLEFHQQKWITKKWLNIGANFSEEFLNSLVKAKHITETLFDQHSTTPHLTFQLYPKPTPGLRQINLQIGKQIYHYTNGPQQWYTCIWPDQTINQEIHLSAVTANGLDTTSIKFNGPWSILHLCKTAQIEPQGNSVYQLSWFVNTTKHHRKKISFLLRINHKNDFLKNILKQSFHLPNHV